MALSEETRRYIDGQIDYYIGEADSYRQMAQMYSQTIDSVADAAFGIIVGCVYSAFLQTFAGRQGGPTLEETQELGEILEARAPLIRKALVGEAARI